MSRSRRQPFATESYGKRCRGKAKRAAARAVRQQDVGSDIPKKPSSYKKLYNSWNICDYSFYTPNNYRFRRK